MSVQVITSSAEFDAALKAAGDKLVVVDFYADWCGPCKRIAPDVKKLAEENENVVFLKVNVDEAGDLAEDKGIEAMPTFHFYKSGELKTSFKGASLEKLKENVASLQ